MCGVQYLRSIGIQGIYDPVIVACVGGIVRCRQRIHVTIADPHRNGDIGRATHVGNKPVSYIHGEQVLIKRTATTVGIHVVTPGHVGVDNQGQRRIDVTNHPVRRQPVVHNELCVKQLLA